MKDNCNPPFCNSSDSLMKSETNKNVQSVFQQIAPGAKIFFVGIGGVSMGGLSELSILDGYDVAGSDSNDFLRAPILRDRGIHVFIGHDAENIRSFSPDLLVYTAAIGAGNPEIDYARRAGIPVLTRADFLGGLTRRFDRVINVAGTHGKTTTTSMLAEILIESGVNPTVHLGAEYVPFGAAIRQGDKDALFVSEACEYQRSFLSFRSTTAAITNIDYDHADCYASIDEIIDVFSEFTDKLDDAGHLVLPAHDENIRRCVARIRERRARMNRAMPHIQTIAIEDMPSTSNSKNVDFIARNIVFESGYPSFDLVGPGDLSAHIKLSVPGRHNIANAVTAIACAALNGGTPEGMQVALARFRGAEGRFTIRGKVKGALVVVDYAHHPTEVRATLQAVSQIPHNQLWVVFQPLTFNRFKIFFEDFASVFLPVDHVIFADIFSDREVNDGTISSSSLVDRMRQLGGNAQFIPDINTIHKKLLSVIGADDILLLIGPKEIQNLANDFNYDA